MPGQTGARILSEHEIEDIAVRASRKTLDGAFISLGIDPSDPVKAQDDFAALRKMKEVFEDPEYQLDRAHLRKIRTYSERIANFSIAALISAVVGGIVTLLWAGYQMLMKAPPHGP